MEHLDAVQVRVLGSLIEKQRTTPDAYPLSLNGLRLACNQATSRDPVVDYDERTIREALDRLGGLRYSRLTSGPGSRTAKFRQILDETLSLGPAELALLAVLMLRGPQTAAELRARSDRLHVFPSFAAVEETLDRLAARHLVVLLDRRPGQKEQRYAQLLGGPVSDDQAPHRARSEGPTPEPLGGDLVARVAALETALLDLLARVDELEQR